MGPKKASDGSFSLLWWSKWILTVWIVLLACWIGYPQPELNMEGDILPLARNYASLTTTATTTSSSSQPLKGVRVVITGATSGIGLGLVKQFAAMGATVIAMGRSPQKLKTLQDSISVVGDDGTTIRTVEVQLADLESVQKAAQQIIDDFDSIDILINNAGIHYIGQPSGGDSDSDCDTPPTTPQNIDMSFGVNYVSHFLLAEKLVPLLNNSTFHPTIIQVSSSYHWAVDGSDLMIPTTNQNDPTNPKPPLAAIPGAFSGSIFASQRAYSNSKLAQILHARAFQRRYPKIRLKSICPCWVGTGIGGKEFEVLLGQTAFPFNGYGLKSTLVAALDTTTIASESLSGTVDYYTNSPMTQLAGQLPPQVFATWAYQWKIRDFLFVNFANLLLSIQKFGATVEARTSSPESYNETLQEELYQWSYKTIQPYL